MRGFRKFMAIVMVSTVAACHSAPPGPMTWSALITRVQRDTGLHMLAQIHAAPQPAAAKELMAPAISILIRGGVYQEAQNLAVMAVNTFPTDPLYRQLLAEAYQAGIAAGDTSSRTQKKMHHELERAEQLRRKSP